MKMLEVTFKRMVSIILICELLSRVSFQSLFWVFVPENGNLLSCCHDQRSRTFHRALVMKNSKPYAGLNPIGVDNASYGGRRKAPLFGRFEVVLGSLVLAGNGVFERQKPAESGLLCVW